MNYFLKLAQISVLRAKGKRSFSNSILCQMTLSYIEVILEQIGEKTCFYDLMIM